MALLYPDIEPRILHEWTEITELLATLCKVPSALIMRQNEESMEVISCSECEDSPYEPNEKAPLEGELYCETVVATQAPLNVPNAIKDPHWANNPDVELGMISYYGVPINWPDGYPFGTLCILDKKERHVTVTEKTIIQRFANIVEMTLELMLSERQMHFRAITDELTQTFNRRYYFETLEKEFARCKRYNTPLSVVMIDLDFFKVINDKYGHQMGDKVLKMFSTKLKNTIREQDVLARIGGEEFGLIMPQTNRDGADQLICRFQQAFTLSDELPDMETITFSAGVAEVKCADKDMEQLMQRADERLYQAKSEGRNKVVSA